MADFPSWIQDNWPAAITAIGVIGSLWIGIRTSDRDAKTREKEALDRIAELHERLWTQMSAEPRLQRILQRELNTPADSITVGEEEFINRVMVHFLRAWRDAKDGGMISLEELSKDAGVFFSLPLPHAVWERTKQFRNPRFVQFVGRALDRRGRSRSDSENSAV